MSPVAPMPQGSPVGTNGLKSWVIEVSGELSMTRVFPVVVAVELELELELALVLELDEHAASPPASTAAAVTASSRLWLCNLLITFVFLSLRLWGLVRGSYAHLFGSPGDELGRGDIQPPAGRAPRGRYLHESRVLPAAAVIGERAPGAERAADRRRALRVLRPM